jgi:hypothetical protein
MTKKTLCLTPECYKLWAIRPGLCFLYDRIVIDTRDYDDITTTADDSNYNVVLFRNVERLRMEGILECVPYEPLLPSHTRANIHEQAAAYVDTLSEHKRITLAQHAHREYEQYLKGQLLFCQPAEPKFRTLSARLARMKTRRTELSSDATPTRAIDETLKRIVAKSLAGTYIVSQIDNGHLYDTSEYRPFIDAIPIAGVATAGKTIDLHDDAEDKAVDIVAALVLNKRLPDVTVYDDHSLTVFLRTREDLDRLRSVIQGVLARYHVLIKADSETAYAHLEKDFRRAMAGLNAELARIRKRTGLLWKITEVLASLNYSIIKPFLQPLHDKNMRTHREIELDKLAKKDKLLADLLYVFDKVRFGEGRYDIAVRKTFPEPKETAQVLWGEAGLNLPWYETPGNSAHVSEHRSDVSKDGQGAVEEHRGGQPPGTPLRSTGEVQAGRAPRSH